MELPLVEQGRWGAERAQAWYDGRPAPYGVNLVPSTAVNSTEMWQEETFDPITLDRELGLAERCGFNSCRVFVQHLVWRDDPRAMRDRLDTFLSLADGHGISTVPILYDDCAFAGKEPHLGPQAAPIAGLHNSGWTPSPGPRSADDRAAWPDLEAYVQDLVGSFGTDRRVLLWDLYNEPGNGGRGDRSLPLLEHVFAWARAVTPAQPLTVGAWGYAPADARALALCDVVTFHDYDPLSILLPRLAALKARGYPVICTEWMARTRGSLPTTHLPFFARERIGCYLWGLVNGRTQTHLPWESPEGGPEPDLWFHDLFHADGTPYDQVEIDTIKMFSAELL